MVGNKYLENDVHLRKHHIPDDVELPLPCDLFSPF